MSKVAVGDHICTPFVSEEGKLEALTAFIAGGLERNERVLIVASPTLTQDLAAPLSKVGVDAQNFARRGQLIWVPDHLAYAGITDPADTWESIKAQTLLAREHGFSGLRAAGAPPTLHNTDELLAYEDGLDDVRKAVGTTFMCLYCKPRTRPELMRNLLAAHPQVWLQDRLFRNTFFTPGAFRPGHSPTPAQQLDWTLHQLLRSHDDEGHERELEEQSSGKPEEFKRLAMRLARGIEHRDRLVGIVARQLRGSLNQLEAARLQPNSDDAREATERLAHLGERIEAVRDLLGESHDSTPRTLDLSALLLNHTQQLRRTTSMRAELLSLHADEPVMGRFDEARILRMLEHLVRLALRHGCDGPVDVSVEKQGPAARISVRYQGLDGAGAAAALAGREGKLELYDWLGIDLFLVREMVRRMDGVLAVASWPDDTVLFSVELPRNTLSSFGQ